MKKLLRVFILPHTKPPLSRKQLRRDRIARLNSDDGNTLINEEEEPSSQVNFSSYKKISMSTQRLLDAQSKSTEVITDARVKIDQREAKRRDAEVEDNEKRTQLLANVSDTSRQYEEEVALGWKCLAATNVQDLSKLLTKQQRVCETALAKLQNVSNELGSELREKDHEYVTALKRNRQEVEQLQLCITNEHQMLKEAFEKELQLIEESLVADRNYILSTNKNELEALMSKRKEVETESLERQRQIIQQHRHEIDQSEAKGKRDREELKKKLESEVRRLEIELEDTRARHQFDTDKLEYNVRELTELSENEEAAAKQKRRIMKGKQDFNRELENKQQAKSKGMRQNEILEGDCERIEISASGMREKFERFKVSDDEKYRAVLTMHREDLQKLQSELQQSQDFIFGGGNGNNAFGAEQSYTSDVTWYGGSGDTVKSNKTNECKLNETDEDEFGLESSVSHGKR